MLCSGRVWASILGPLTTLLACTLAHNVDSGYTVDRATIRGGHLLRQFKANSRKNCALLAVMFLAYRYQQSLSRCFACPNVCVQQSHAAKRLNWSATFEYLLPCYCYAIKTNRRTVCSQMPLPASAGKWAHMSDLKAHHFMTPEQLVWLLGSMSTYHVGK